MSISALASLASHTLSYAIPATTLQKTSASTGDADGDSDGSKAPDAVKSAASLGNIGNIINTTA